MRLLFLGILPFLISCKTDSTELERHEVITTKEADAKAGEKLYQVSANDNIGFINAQGKVVIDIKFKDASFFSEGLAPARETYRFGYIDHTGAFVIEPKFDAGGPFIKGLARVFIDGSPAVINKTGNYIVEPNRFKSIDYFFDGVSIVESKGGLFGGVDTTGNLVIDTIYKEITPFNSNRAVVTGINHPDDIRIREQEIGVINTHGKLVVPFNKYFNIERFSEGFAKVEVYNEKYNDDSYWSSYEGLIDTNGTLIFQTTKRLDRYVVSGFIKASVNYTTDLFLTTKGDLAFDFFPYDHLWDIEKGVFINWTMNEYQIYDTTGKLLTPAVYSHAYITQGNNIQIRVANEDGNWGLINTNGDTIIPLKYNSMHQVGLVNNRIFYREEIGDTYQYIWGILNEKGDTIVPAKFTNVQYSGFENDLVYVEQDSLYGYIDKNGSWVWKNYNDYHNQNLSYDFSPSYMLRAYTYVKPSRADSLKEKYDWISFPKKVAGQFPENKLGLMVDTTKTALFAKRYKGYKAYFYNTSGDSVEIEVQDDKLKLTMQVKVGDEWKNIEYMPSTFCGNSYYDVELLNNEYWEFTIPKYQGEKEYEARLRLVVEDIYNHGELLSETVIHSNTFNVKVNPGQFWNKQGHTSGGIMDPYLD